MNFSTVLEDLDHASAFELYRLRLSSDRKCTKRSGEEMRLSNKTVRLKVGQQQRRVAYQFLHPVIYAQAGAAVRLPGQATLLPAARS